MAHADVSDRDIFASAKLVIKQHGGSAVYFASIRVYELGEAGDTAGAAVWRRVMKAVEEIQAMEPAGRVQ